MKISLGESAIPEKHRLKSDTPLKPKASTPESTPAPIVDKVLKTKAAVSKPSSDIVLKDKRDVLREQSLQMPLKKKAESLSETAKRAEIEKSKRLQELTKKGPPGSDIKLKTKDATKSAEIFKISRSSALKKKFDYSQVRLNYTTNDIFHPILDTTQDGRDLLSQGFMTVDGRIGVIREFPTPEDLLTAFTALRKKYSYLHIQAQDFFGRNLLSVSKFLPIPARGIRAIFTPFSGQKHATEVRDIFLHLTEITASYNAKVICTYPETPWYPEHHVLKYKYMSSWPPTRSAFAPIRGFCVLHYPFEERVAIMYYTTLELRELLARRILCVEFINSFKTLALYFWMPFGGCSYVAERFKMISH